MKKTHKQLFDVVDLEQGTEEWLAWRHSGIGASDAATVMGENRFQSPSDLLHQKRRRINTEPTEQMQLGTSLEPEARDRYMEETGIVVRPLCLQSRDYPWLLASIDGMSDDYSHMVEIKCGKSAYWQAHKGKVPDYYYGQLQHQLMITGLSKVDYWCYWPGQNGILQTVTRDASYIKKLLRTEKAFVEELFG